MLSLYQIKKNFRAADNQKFGGTIQLESYEFIPMVLITCKTFIMTIIGANSFWPFPDILASAQSKHLHYLQT